MVQATTGTDGPCLNVASRSNLNQWQVTYLRRILVSNDGPKIHPTERDTERTNAANEHSMCPAVSMRLSIHERLKVASNKVLLGCALRTVH
jgi:hypothetical protein